MLCRHCTTRFLVSSATEHQSHGNEDSEKEWPHLLLNVFIETLRPHEARSTLLPLKPNEPSLRRQRLAKTKSRPP